MRLIDADALMELIKKEQSEYENNGYDEWLNGIYLGLDKAIDEIEEAPTVDAVALPCKVGGKVFRIDKGNFSSGWKPFVQRTYCDGNKLEE